MKKMIALFTMLALSVSTFSFMLGASAADNAAESAEVYLVPGYYYDDTSGEKQYNTVTGATKLTEEQEAAIFTENVYLAGESGEVLPDPQSEREDWSFHGWWYTVDAEIVYTETVPDAGTEDVFLYADWRNDFSLPSEPVPRRQGMRKKQCATICASRTATAMLNT